MKKKHFFLLSIILGVTSCLTHEYLDHTFRETYVDHREMLHIDSSAAPYLKLHFGNGDVALLETWNYIETLDSVTGTGFLYDFNRRVLKAGGLSFPTSDIALVESNRLDKVKDRTPESMAQLRIMAGLDGALGALCLTMPKACFGSCPTFYVKGMEDLSDCRAEAFSEAILPSMASTDIDALNYSSAEEEFEIVMKNEALETHILDQITLISVPRSIEENVFADGQDRFYRCHKARPPVSAKIGNKSVLEEIASVDELELRTRTAEGNLMVFDTIDLVFNSSGVGDGGLVLHFKQTLLTTYLFYHALSLLGDEAVDQMTKIEIGELGASTLWEPLIDFGSIRIYQEQDMMWEEIGAIKEIGPIAHNLEVVPLQPTIGEDPIKIKLVMTKGFWLLNYIGMTPNLEEVQPKTYIPSSMEVIYGSPGLNLDQISKEDDKQIVTMAYDEILFGFCLEPVGRDSVHEFFISATGYYLEWLRKEWMAEKDLMSFYKMIKLDSDYWEYLAKDYKSIEAQMDNVFWQSNHQRPIDL